jgi:hypothetical protein
MSNLHISYDDLLKMDRNTIYDFYEWMKEQSTGRSKLNEGHKEMIAMAKKEREEWAKQK